MSKQDYIMQGRNEGIAFCDKIAKEKGLEELQRVTRQRNLAGLRTLIDPRELDQDFRDATLQILDTVLIMSLIVLKDEFDFGTKRLDRFKKRFNDKTECLETGNVTWIDMIEQVREENNIKLDLRKNDVVMAEEKIMVNKKEFEGYICEITNKPIGKMKLCPDKQQKLKVRIKCDDSCIHCEKEVIDND